jgi:hypothetical protein
LAAAKKALEAKSELDSMATRTEEEGELREEDTQGDKVPDDAAQQVKAAREKHKEAVKQAKAAHDPDPALQAANKRREIRLKKKHDAALTEAAAQKFVQYKMNAAWRVWRAWDQDKRLAFMRATSRSPPPMSSTERSESSSPVQAGVNPGVEVLETVLAREGEERRAAQRESARGALGSQGLPDDMVLCLLSPCRWLY